MSQKNVVIFKMNFENDFEPLNMENPKQYKNQICYLVFVFLFFGLASQIHNTKSKNVK